MPGGNGTVVETLVTELDARTLGLETKLAEANKLLEQFKQRATSAEAAAEGAEARLQQMKEKAAESGVVGEAMGVQFETGLSKVKVTAAAAGIALAALAVKATETAARVDGALRTIGAASPGTRGALPQVKADMEDLADEAGRSAEEMEAAGKQLAQLGVASEADFKQKLAAATLLADATGQQLSETVAGVDQLGNTFGIAADKVTAGLAEIFATSAGRANFADVFQVLQQIAPRVHELNLDLDTASRATVTLLGLGYTPRKIGSFFAEHDAAAIKEMARQATVAQDPMKELQDAADFTRGGQDRDLTRGVNAYNRAMAELGDKLLPTAAKAAHDLAVILDHLDGTFDRFMLSADVATVGMLGALAGRGKIRSDGSAPSIRLGQSIQNLQTGLRNGTFNPAQLSLDDLHRLQEGLAGYLKMQQRVYGNRENWAEYAKTYQPLISAVNDATAAQERLNRASGASGTGGTTGTKKTGGVIIPPTEAELKQRAAAMVAFDEAIAAASPRKADDLDAQIEKLRKAAIDAGVGIRAIDAKTAELRAAARAAAEAHVKSLVEDLDKQLQQFSGSQVQAFVAAQQRIVDEAQQKLDAEPLTPAEKTAAQKRINDYQIRATMAAGVLRLVEDQTRADQEAAAALALLDGQTQLLATHEQQLQAEYQLQTTSAARRIEISRELAAARAEELRLAKEQLAANQGELARVDQELAALNLQKAATVNAKDQDTLAERIRQKEQQRLQLLEKIAKLMGVQVQLAVSAQEQYSRELQVLRTRVSLIQQSVDAALDLAGAFNLANGETAGMLKNMAGMMSALPELAKTIGDLKAGKEGSSLTSVITAALPVAAALTPIISSIFGSSPERDRQLQVQQDNTDAIRELTQHIGDLSKANVSGTDLQNARAASLAVIAGMQSGSLFPGGNPFGPLAQFGLTKKELEDLAQQLGITLDGSLKSFQALVQAIDQADLASYTDSFAGSLERLQDAFQVYDITDPADKLARTIKTVTDSKTGIPALAKALSGIDTSTQAGAQQAIAQLQQLYEQLASGSLTAADLGGASVDETRQAIIDLITQLRGAGGGPSGTGGYNVSQTITEVTGSRIGSLLATANVWHQRTTTAVEAIAAVLGAGAALTVRPPAIPSSGVAGSGQVVINGNIVVNVTVSGAASPDQAAAIGAAAGQAAGQAATAEIQQVSLGLERERRFKRLAAGTLQPVR